MAADYCGTCQMARMFSAGEDALYHCGTTSLMLAEGWHNDGRTDAEKNKVFAYWRQHLARTGRSSTADVMLPQPRAARRARVTPRSREAVAARG